MPINQNSQSLIELSILIRKNHYHFQYPHLTNSGDAFEWPFLLVVKSGNFSPEFGYHDVATPQLPFSNLKCLFSAKNTVIFRISTQKLAKIDMSSSFLIVVTIRPNSRYHDATMPSKYFQTGDRDRIIHIPPPLVILYPLHYGTEYFWQKSGSPDTTKKESAETWNISRIFSPFR